MHGLRLQILRLLVMNRITAEFGLVESTTSPLNYTALATKTEGFNPSDLKDLIAVAFHHATIRMATAGDAKNVVGSLAGQPL